jgi:hypothetical protein
VIRTMTSHTSLETTIVYRETVERCENAIFESIVSRIVDKFVEEHYEAIKESIDMGIIAGNVGGMVSSKIEDIFRREMKTHDVGDESLRTKRMMAGLCPECGQNWKNNIDIDGHQPFYPEFRATLEECNINPSTGHKRGCSLQGGV